jgi:hypothetical protein
MQSVNVSPQERHVRDLTEHTKLPIQYIVTWRLKARIVERKETSTAGLQQYKQPAIAKQRLCRYVLGATEAEATMDELLEEKHATIQ